ncbi:MAG: hypothetical protein EXR71_13030 [Myxococcales bacterium]|nr:hypothetical protein [Myxococcales bacterium]
MIKINLLPIRQTRKAEALQRETLLAALLGAVVAGGCLFVWAGFTIRDSGLAAENTALNAEITRLKKEADDVDKMEAAKAELERKLSVIATLRERKTGPAHMLDELALAAPEKLQMLTLDEHAGNLEFGGLAVSNEVISQFLRALEASDYFEQVYLQNIEAFEAKDKSSSVLLKEFSLTSRLVESGKAITPAVAPATPTEAAPVAPVTGAPPAGAPAAPGATDGATAIPAAGATP